MNDEEFVKSMMENENDAFDPSEEGHLAMYLAELEELPYYEGDALRALKMNVLAGRNSAKTSLMEHYMHDVVDIARLYMYQGLKLSELISEGNMAVCVAVNALTTTDNLDAIDEIVNKAIMEAMDLYADEFKADRDKVEYRPTEFEQPEDLLENISNTTPKMQPKGKKN